MFVWKPLLGCELAEVKLEAELAAGWVGGVQWLRVYTLWSAAVGCSQPCACKCRWCQFDKDELKLEAELAASMVAASMHQGEPPTSSKYGPHVKGCA